MKNGMMLVLAVTQMGERLGDNNKVRSGESGRRKCR